MGDQAGVEVSRGSVLLSMEWSCCLDPKLDRRLDEEPVRDDPLRRIAKARERRRLERGSFLLGHGLRGHFRRRAPAQSMVRKGGRKRRKKFLGGVL